MATLTYWAAFPLDDHRCYAIRATTRKQVQAELDTGEYPHFTSPCKIVLTYRGAFDLMQQLNGPGGCLEEMAARDAHSDAFEEAQWRAAART
jgi:hypothetical protein